MIPEDPGQPGRFPFTRGIHPEMYRSRMWTMRQYAGFGDAEESNHRYRYLIAQGQKGLSLAFDLPTQMGMDSDHPMALGEVGKVGVAIDSLEDMETLFHGIRLEDISTSMTINATASILLCLYVAVAKTQGADLNKLSGTVQNDILKEYIARGTYIYPVAPAMRLITDLFAWCHAELPLWNTISISGYHIREAGATAVQELAFTVADGIAYVEAARAAGLEVDEFAPRLSFFFNAQMNLLEEVSKYRAARRLWARIMDQRFGARDPKSQMLRFHTQTSGASLAAQQPNVNLVRTAIEALAAVLGGTQSLHTNSRDEALGLPTEESVLLALRTQQIIGHETGVANTVDPLGGAGYIEEKTAELEHGAEAYIRRIDAMGGMIKAIEAGFVQSEIQNSAYDYQRAVETGRQIVVGVNRFQQDEQAMPAQYINPALEQAQVERVQGARARRDAAACQAALSAVEETAHGQENLMPRILRAVEAHATVGEISDALRRVFGEYRETGVVEDKRVPCQNVMMLILGSESSCDETSAALVEDGARILSNVVASQVATHAEYGGVVPELASREHLRAIVPIVRQAFATAGRRYGDVDAVAVTAGPGLVGSLLVGLTYAKAMALSLGKPLIGVNHLEGHIHSVLLERRTRGEPEPELPALALIVSGGHTLLVRVERDGDGPGLRYRIIGRTRDDAAGEAYDKVAKLLGLGYPGGPVIDRLAGHGDARAVPFTPPKIKGSLLDFSFSGIKTAVLRYVQTEGLEEEARLRRTHLPATAEQLLPLCSRRTLDLLASFQYAVVEDLWTRTRAAAQAYDVRTVMVSGGVACNSLLRRRFAQLDGLPVSFPSPALSTDNAAMIAAAAYPKMLAGRFGNLDLGADPQLQLEVS